MGRWRARNRCATKKTWRRVALPALNRTTRKWPPLFFAERYLLKPGVQSKPDSSIPAPPPAHRPHHRYTPD